MKVARHIFYNPHQVGAARRGPSTAQPTLQTSEGAVSTSHISPFHGQAKRSGSRVKHKAPTLTEPNVREVSYPPLLEGREVRGAPDLATVNLGR